MRIAYGAALVFLAVIAFGFFDSIADIWPAVGVQAEVCQRFKGEEPPPDVRTTDAMTDAYKIACGAEGPVAVTRVNVEGMRMALSPDQALMAIAGLAAALGAIVVSFASLLLPPGTPVSERPIAWNVLRPFAALALGAVIYFVLRAIFEPSGLLTRTMPYPYIAVAAVTGLLAEPLMGLITGRRRRKTP